MSRGSFLGKLRNRRVYACVVTREQGMEQDHSSIHCSEAGMVMLASCQRTRLSDISKVELLDANAALDGRPQLRADDPAALRDIIVQV